MSVPFVSSIRWYISSTSLSSSILSVHHLKSLSYFLHSTLIFCGLQIWCDYRYDVLAITGCIVLEKILQSKRCQEWFPHTEDMSVVFFIDFQDEEPCLSNHFQNKSAPSIWMGPPLDSPGIEVLSYYFVSRSAENLIFRSLVFHLKVLYSHLEWSSN